MTRLNPAIAHGLVEHQRDRGGGGVAIAGQVAEHPLGGNGEALGHGIEDPLVGLVQQQPVELVGTGAGAIEQVLEDRRHLAHREFVDLLAIHLDRFEAASLGLAAGHHPGVLLDLGQGEAAITAAIGAHAEAQ